MMALARKYGWNLKQMDVKTAFLYALLHEEIYIEIPECFREPGDEDYVWKLNKALYGLKQSPRMWNKTLDDFLTTQGFKASQADPCIYVRQHKGEITMIAVYYIFASASCPALLFLLCLFFLSLPFFLVISFRTCEGYHMFFPHLLMHMPIQDDASSSCVPISPAYFSMSYLFLPLFFLSLVGYK